MKQHIAHFLLITFYLCLLPTTGLPCTTFVLDNNGTPVYGKNMDWMPVPAYVMVNKRGVTKKIVSASLELSGVWTSKYGSITCNFFARDLAFEGINEAGLFISAMGFFDCRQFPETDERPGMLVDQWIQYQLDNFSTLDEVIASASAIRIENPVLHFLAADRQGNVAVIEFPYGEMITYSGDALPVNVLTNTAYADSLEVLTKFKGHGGRLPVPRRNFIPVMVKYPNSYLRFVCAADMLNKFDPQGSVPAVDYAFRVLDRVPMLAVSGKSVWRTVYDDQNSSIFFKSYYNSAIRFLDTTAFDFSCATPVLALDVNADFAGDVTGSFVEYTASMSREMLESNRETPLFTLTDEFIDFWTTYSDTHTFCAEDQNAEGKR